MPASLKEVEALVDDLTPADRQQLLQYLAPRVDAQPPADASHAWEEFRRVGERLAAKSNGESITQAISEMRLV